MSDCYACDTSGTTCEPCAAWESSNRPPGPVQYRCEDCGGMSPCQTCGVHNCTDECGACGGGCQCDCFCPTMRDAYY